MNLAQQLPMNAKEYFHLPFTPIPFITHTSTAPSSTSSIGSTTTSICRTFLSPPTPISTPKVSSCLTDHFADPCTQYCCPDCKRERAASPPGQVCALRVYRRLLRCADASISASAPTQKQSSRRFLRLRVCLETDLNRWSLPYQLDLFWSTPTLHPRSAMGDGLRANFNQCCLLDMRTLLALPHQLTYCGRSPHCFDTLSYCQRSPPRASKTQIRSNNNMNPVTGPPGMRRVPCPRHRTSAARGAVSQNSLFQPG